MGQRSGVLLLAAATCGDFPQNSGQVRGHNGSGPAICPLAWVKVPVEAMAWFALRRSRTRGTRCREDDEARTGSGGREQRFMNPLNIEGEEGKRERWADGFHGEMKDAKDIREQDRFLLIANIIQIMLTGRSRKTLVQALWRKETVAEASMVEVGMPASDAVAAASSIESNGEIGNWGDGEEKQGRKGVELESKLNARFQLEAWN
ncbi:hypothetical protein LXL04_012604 [Taraxacum kok-saghyz]